jgi:hypothetical protein
MTDIPAHEAAGRERAQDIIRAAILPVTLSIVAGIGTALLEVSIGLGIVAALLVGVIALQIQLLTTIGKADVEAQVILHELAPVTKVLELDKSTGEFLLSLATAQIEFLMADPQPPPVFNDELEFRRKRLLGQYEECARREMHVSLVASPIIRETDGVSAVGETLRATSLVPPLTYWDVARGLSYLVQQEGMLEDGVSIKRVFIQNSTALDELSRVMATHLEWRDRYGDDLLDVRVVLLDEPLDDDLVVDFAVVDASAVIRLATQHGIDHPTAVVWEAEPSAVAQGNSRFERLWQGGCDPTSFPQFKR